MTVGPTLSNDLRESIGILCGTKVATGPIDSVNGFKINGTSINAKSGDTGTVKAGSYTMVAGDDTAGLTDIATGLSTITSFIIQILRSTVPIASDQKYTATGGTLRVADGASTYACTAGDVVKWIAVGAL